MGEWAWGLYVTQRGSCHLIDPLLFNRQRAHAATMAELTPPQVVEEGGGPNKRPRLWQQHRQASYSHQRNGWEGEAVDDEENTGCVCSNAGCPWNFSSRRVSPMSSNGPTSPDVEPNHGVESDALRPRQFFDGPLLSVKEYRDQPTGEVRY